MTIVESFSSSASLTPPEAPRWRSVEEARRILAEELSGFLAAVAAGEPLETPTLAFRASAGTGKTHMLLERLGALAAPLLYQGHIQMFVPTHDLAEEACGAFRRLHPNIPAMVLRGRDAINPESGGTMCFKADLVRDVGEILGNVSEALCQTWDQTEGRMRRSMCRRGCPWYEQIPTGPTVIFLAHAYLTSGMPVPGDVVLRVIDEKFYANFLVENTISIANWLPPSGVDAVTSKDQAFMQSLDDAREIVARALRNDQPVNESLHNAGHERADISAFRQHELSMAPQLSIHPKMSTCDQRSRIDGFDLKALRVARARARVWQVVHESWDRPTSERLALEAYEVGGEKAHRIRAHRRDEMNQDIPTILLDADADPLIVETLRPGARFIGLDVAPNAEIVQVHDRTFSTVSLVSHPKAAELRRDVLSVIGREVARASAGVLLVGTKEVLRQLHQDVDPTATVAGDEALMRPILGAEARWFGPRLQGVNTYKEFETVILLGRLEPPVEAIDTQLRSFGADGETPLTFASGSTGACGWFPKQAGWYLRPGGGFDLATVRRHPDRRGAALLAQNREAHLLQAMARIRAVGSPTRKRIVILCSIPLPNVPVTDLVSWRELLTDLPDAIARKLTLLRRAIDRPDGSSLHGLRLSVAGAVEDAPNAFPNRNVSGEWRRGMPTEAVRDLALKFAATDGRVCTFVRLWKGGGGRACPAVVMVSADRAREVAAKLWPGYVAEP